jgi:hypothetical protein
MGSIKRRPKKNFKLLPSKGNAKLIREVYSNFWGAMASLDPNHGVQRSDEDIHMVQILQSNIRS